MFEVGAIETHEGLTGLHRITHVDQPFGDFSPDAEAEIALHARSDNAREAAFRCCRRHNIDYTDQLILGSRIAFGRGACGEAEQQDGHNDSNA